MPLYSEIYVDSVVERFVKKLWCLDNSANSNISKDMMLLPNGCFNFGIVQGEGLEVCFNAGKYSLEKGHYLCSQVTEKALVKIKPFTKIIFIQLHAWTLSYISDVDFSNHINKVFRSDQISFSSHFDLKFNTTDLNEIVNEVNNIFKDLNIKYPEKGIVEEISTSLKTNKIPVTNIINKVSSKSTRATQIKFKRSTGMTIKEYSSIMNFRDSVDGIKEAKDTNKLTCLALDYGYYDQSHYTHMFKKIVGITPKEFDPKSFILSKN